MKKFTILLLLIFAFGWSYSQNLVLNPSFENINTNCSGFGGAGYTNLVTWDNPDPTDTCSTPDWFSTCLSNIFPTAAPNSWLGSQMPHTGNAYGGIILYEALSDSYREYLEGQLSAPLVAGQTYCVSFFISLADTVPYAVDKIGVYLSNNFVQFPVSHCDVMAPLPVTPQLQWNGAAITDDVNWLKLQWQYTATGGEQYFVIGNFFNNANTTIVNTGGGGWMNPYAYYFIDDVSVVAGICCDASIVNTTPLCSDAANLNLMANTSGGTWSGTGITNTTAGTFSATTAGVGSHLITYTLPCGASDTATIVVNDCMEVCVDGNGNWNVSGGAAPYTWQAGNTTQDCSACLIGCIFPPGCAVNTTTWTTFATGSSIPAPTTLPIKVIDNNGQTILIDSATVLPPCGTNCPFAVTVNSNTPASCNASDGSVSISANGGAAPYNYSWNNGQTVATATNLFAGNYTCLITDATSCQTTFNVTVATTSNLSATASATMAACADGKTGTASASVLTGTPPYTYSWNVGGSTPTITNLLAGTYTCTITDASNCSVVVSATVVQPPTLIVTGSSTPSTSGNNGSATATVSGGAAPYTYSWQTNPIQYTQTINGLAAGAYTCVVHDANGCAKIITVTVTEANSINAQSIGINHINLSPNPTQDKVTLNLTLQNPDKVQLTLYDISGKVLFQSQSDKLSTYQKELLLESVSAGIYLLKIQTSKGEITTKIVKE